jgi:hypothetical protein
MAIDETLASAFSLVESDLLKDLSAAVSAYIEVSVARQQGLELIFSDSHIMHAMILQNEYTSLSLTSGRQQLRVATSSSRRRRLRRSLGNKLFHIKHGVIGLPNLRSISTNTLSRELTSDRATLIRINHSEVAAQRRENGVISNDIYGLAEVVSENIRKRLNNAGHEVTNNFSDFVNTLVVDHIHRGWLDRNYRPGFKPTSAMTLFTGSGGNYLARLVSHTFYNAGARVVRSTHGGDAPLFRDPLWSSIELPFANDYVTYGTGGATEVKQLVDARQEKIPSTGNPTIHAGGSLFHSKIPSDSAANKRIKTVHVIAQSFTGELRVLPNYNLPDVLYYDWHRRLLSAVKSAGFTTISKRHPKGIRPELETYGDTATSELRQASMADTYASAGAYVLDFAGSAFMEAMCTLKPVVLVHFPNRRLTDTGRQAIKKSAQLIEAKFDDRNRVVVDNQQLIDSINAPVNIEARQEFIQNYLTSYSDDILEIKHLIR